MFPTILNKLIAWFSDVAVNWNHTSSSSDPPQELGSGDGVAATKVPEENSVQDESEFGVIIVAWSQLSFSGGQA